LEQIGPASALTFETPGLEIVGHDLTDRRDIVLQPSLVDHLLQSKNFLFVIRGNCARLLRIGEERDCAGEK